MINLNSPIHRIETDFIRKSKVNVLMKRDDLIHPFISGNKWRKLKYNIEQFKALGKRKISTFGGAYSNHLIATAAACAMEGIESIGIVRGEELSNNSNYVLRICAEFGMDLHFVSRKDYADKPKLYKHYESEGCYIIPEGGANKEGSQGCEEIVDDYNLYDHIVLAVGTGTTISAVIEASKGNSFIHGVSAVGDGAYLSDNITHNTKQKNWKLHTSYAFGGFGKFDSSQIAFNKTFAKETGILLDPIYTGKMMRGLYDLIQIGEIKAGQTVLCVHTGGLTGLLSAQWLSS